MSSNKSLRPRQMLNRVCEAPSGGPSRRVVPNTTMRSGSGARTGLSRTVLTTEKMAVFVPMPSASAITAVIANPGFCRNVRRECCKSRSIALAPAEDLPHPPRDQLLIDRIVHEHGKYDRPLLAPPRDAPLAFPQQLLPLVVP